MYKAVKASRFIGNNFARLLLAVEARDYLSSYVASSVTISRSSAFKAWSKGYYSESLFSFSALKKFSPFDFLLARALAKALYGY